MLKRRRLVCLDGELRFIWITVGQEHSGEPVWGYRGSHCDHELFQNNEFYLDGRNSGIPDSASRLLKRLCYEALKE